ncbi:unnamed protein product [Sphenostylis stenocarpa]|uniref:Uncharacterized protein n=1 Tax=Sphenostylis stenocarpa TaxID=92480 RepID=A0AA86W0F2_9FABA|nr:unnamed protein product [Sphenostylis stenocarpa]
MNNFQVWIEFLLALSLFSSCALVHSSYPSPTPPSHKPGCYHHTPPNHGHRKPPPPSWLLPPPPPPAAFYFFSPPPPSPPYSQKRPGPVGLDPKHVPPPRLRVL